MVLTAAFVLTACQSPAPRHVAANTAQATRNNCYSLLHQLLEEQKDVSLLRFIKKEHSNVKESNQENRRRLGR